MVYKAPAIKFDGNGWVENDALVCVNSSQIFCSFWLKPTPWTDFASVWTSDPATSFEFLGDESGSASDFTTGLNTPDGSSRFKTSTVPPTNNAWTNYIFGFDTNAASGHRTGIMYVNGVKTTLTIVADTGIAFNNIMNGLVYMVGNDSFLDTYAGLMANFYFNIGNNYLTAGDFDPATIALFYDPSYGGVAVDPALAVAALGTPTICLTGDPTHFPQNSLGSGGAFTPNGSPLTQVGFAPFSPAGIVPPLNVNTNQLPLLRTGFFPNRR